MNRSAKFWNKRAKNFDSKDNPTSEIRKAKYAKIKTYLNPNQQVLDYGCATGSLSQEIANSVREVHGVDISEEMVKIATEKAKDNNYSNIKFIEGDILDEKFDSSKYDVVLAFYVIHLVEDPEKTLKRLAELINPQGFLIMEVPRLKSLNWFKRIFFIPLVKLAGLPYLTHFNQKDIDDMVASTGLTIVDTDLSDDKFPRYFIVAKK